MPKTETVYDSTEMQLESLTEMVSGKFTLDDLAKPETQSDRSRSLKASEGSSGSLLRHTFGYSIPKRDKQCVHYG